MTYTFKIAKRLARMRWSHSILLMGALACVAGDNGPNDPVAPSALVVSPPSANVSVGGAVDFAAWGQTDGGDSVGLSISWSASGGSITEEGIFQSMAAGTFLVVAAHGELADTASVTVLAGPTSPIVSIVVSPSAAGMETGQAVNFDAWGITAAGDSVGVIVSWSSTGGSVTSSGVFHSLVAGTYLVVAAQVGGALADTASITVNAPSSAPATSIVVSPSSASVAAGQTVDFDAWGLTDAGDSVGVSVTWSATASGSISPAGVFSALVAGAYGVTADQVGGSLTRSAIVTVTDSSTPPPPPPPPPPPGLPNECGNPQAGWIWCDDFDQDRLASYFEYSAQSGSFVRANGVGNGGSYAMKASFSAGQVDAGSLHLAVGKTPQTYFLPVDAGTANYREIYWRFYLKNEAGWSGGGGAKLSRAFGFASTTTWAQSMFAHVWSGGTGDNHLVIDPASGTDLNGNLLTTAYNDFPHMRWLGAVPSATSIFDGAHVGQWYCIEAHVKLNTTGQSNGLFELWINGNAEASTNGLNWLGDFSTYGVNAVYLENFWGSGGSPKQQERYFDNFVVSTQRIGC